MRGLPLVRSARFNAVLGTDGRVEFLFPVAIHVPKHQVERSIRVLEPPLVRRGHVLPARVGLRHRAAGRSHSPERWCKAGHQPELPVADALFPPMLASFEKSVTAC